MSSKPDRGFGDRGVAKAFTDAGIGINSKLGVKKTAVSSGSFSRDVSDEGDSLLKRHPIIAEKCMTFVLFTNFSAWLVLDLPFRHVIFNLVKIRNNSKVVDGMLVCYRLLPAILSGFPDRLLACIYRRGTMGTCAHFMHIIN